MNTVILFIIFVPIVSAFIFHGIELAFAKHSKFIEKHEEARVQSIDQSRGV
jgi:hypothetical protein